MHYLFLKKFSNFHIDKIKDYIWNQKSAGLQHKNEVVFKNKDDSLCICEIKLRLKIQSETQTLLVSSVVFPINYLHAFLIDEVGWIICMTYYI